MLGNVHAFILAKGGLTVGKGATESRSPNGLAMAVGVLPGAGYLTWVMAGRCLVESGTDPPPVAAWPHPGLPQHAIGQGPITQPIQEFWLSKAKGSAVSLAPDRGRANL